MQTCSLQALQKRISIVCIFTLSIIQLVTLVTANHKTTNLMKIQNESIFTRIGKYKIKNIGCSI